ncbi:uncharacterized protein LOC134278834 isoform X3 [Saccostrea cucullata]|uniref:uncharacterized protein LOC134278834 isoform X3 n=1 Tax=Saccostrea cuccullata TaxID=36930 RepID=UPI002ED018E3
MEICIFVIACYLLGFALSIDTTWIKSFKICANNDQRMSTEDDVVENNTWLGKAKFDLTWGVLTLQLLRIEENQTCSLTDCGIHQKHCQFCESSVKLNEVSSSFEELKTKLTSEQKYIIEGSWSSDVEEIPVPTTCLVSRGASNTEFVSCNKLFDDGCEKSDGEFNVIIYLEENHKEGSTGPRGSLILPLVFFIIF